MKRTIQYAFHKDDGHVVSRVGDHVACPVCTKHTIEDLKDAETRLLGKQMEDLRKMKEQELREFERLKRELEREYERLMREGRW